MKEKTLKISLLLVSFALVLSLLLNAYLVTDGFSFLVNKPAAIFVDGEEIAVLKSEQSAQSALDKAVDVLLPYKRSEYDEIKILNKIEIQEVKRDRQAIVSEEYAVELLTAKDVKEFAHVIQLYDTPDVICKRYRMTRAEFDELNPKFEENYYIGGNVLIRTISPKITIETARVFTFTEIIPHSTVIVDDNRYYQDVLTTTQSGIDGERSVTAKITEINGFEAERVVLETTVIIEAKDTIVARGTRARP